MKNFILKFINKRINELEEENNTLQCNIDKYVKCTTEGFKIGDIVYENKINKILSPLKIKSFAISAGKEDIIVICENDKTELLSTNINNIFKLN